MNCRRVTCPPLAFQRQPLLSSPSLSFPGAKHLLFLPSSVSRDGKGACSGVGACLGSGFVQFVPCHLSYFPQNVFIKPLCTIHVLSSIFSFPDNVFYFGFCVFSSAASAEDGTMRTRTSQTWRKLSASGVSIWKRN